MTSPSTISAEGSITSGGSRRPAPPAGGTPPTARPRGRARVLADAILAAGPVLYFGWLLAWQIFADWPAFRNPRLDWDTALSLLAVSYLGLQLSTYWRKPPPLAQRRDWRAVLATALAIDALGLSISQPVTIPDATLPAVILTSSGTALAFWSVWHLGKNFSLLPQSRTLVTSGPYRFVRHPIYLGGLLITLAEIWLRFSWTIVALNLVFVAAQVVRLRYEEAILQETFPEYTQYRERTSALIPGIA